jgi:hypothetical protein
MDACWTFPASQRLISLINKWKIYREDHADSHWGSCHIIGKQGSTRNDYHVHLHDTGTRPKGSRGEEARRTANRSKEGSMVSKSPELYLVLLEVYLPLHTTNEYPRATKIPVLEHVRLNDCIWYGMSLRTYHWVVRRNDKLFGISDILCHSRRCGTLSQ